MGLIPETKLELLQAIQSEPTHGYQLAERLELSHGYIYTHLKELREEGMIEVVAEEDEKKIYDLTKNGELLLKALGDDPVE